MTDYVPPLDTRTNPRKPINSEWAKAADNRPLAIAEGAPGAPYVQSSWHPYNGALVGDGFDGRVWSFAVDGAVAAFETPNLVDGYEYQLLCFDLSASSIGGVDFEYRLRRQTDAALGPAISIASASGADDVRSFPVTLRRPRLASRSHIIEGQPPYDLGAVSAVRNIRIVMSGLGSFDSGAAFLYRRRSYV
jgi:hypothetical protein